MATIYNSDLSKELRDGAKLVARDTMPTQLADKVVPVMEVNPKFFRRCNVIKIASSGSTGGLTAYTTPTDKDFYLTGVQYMQIKDAACDTASGGAGGVLITPADSNTSVVCCGYSIITLTAQQFNINREFTIPIKLKPGTTITNTQAFAAGVCQRTLVITGYLVDNITA